MRPVIAATPTAENTITETAAAATSGCSLRLLVFASIASFSFRIANNAQIKGRDDALQ
jgi:hypothetical protein